MTLRTVFLVVITAVLAAVEPAPSPVVAGNARFTVLTPQCLRLEYSSKAAFIDESSYFAVNRTPWNGAQVNRDQGATIIDTGAMHLSYRPDGNPFSAKNLTVRIHLGRGSSAWTPGIQPAGNLGGTIRTLDNANGAVDLGTGILSRDGWALVDDSTSVLLVDGWIKARPKDAGTDWYLFGYGTDYRAGLTSLTQVSGPIPMPRRYTLGCWYSRYWPYSSAEYGDIIKGYTANGFPLDVIVMDMDWHRDGWTGWSWNRQLLPDAEALLTRFHQQGLAVTLNVHPAEGVKPHEDAYPAFMRALHEDPASQKTIPYDAGDRRYMEALFAQVHEPLAKAGVDFWWLDWQQYPNTLSVPEITNLTWLNQLYFQYTASDHRRGVSFSRWGGYGDHRHPIHFSGDTHGTWESLAFQVPFTATAGNVGCMYWSHDIGGHFAAGKGRNDEIYARWVQFGATSAALRSHSSRNKILDRRPWTYEPYACDSMRRAFRLRSELFPYLYTMVRKVTDESVPLTRPMYIDLPEAEEAYGNPQQFMLGDHLLVAPVASPGVGERKVAAQSVWFPAGTWYDLFTGEAFTGPRERIVTADIDEFPLYARGGTPIPMQRYVERMGTSQLNEIVVRCYPGEDGKVDTSRLYEDDGLTTAWQRGEQRTTELGYERHGHEVTIRIAAAVGSYPQAPSRRAWIIELPATDQATTATLDGSPLGISYDAGTRTNRIQVPARAPGSPCTIQVTVSETDRPSVASLIRLRRINEVVQKIAASATTVKQALALVAAAQPKPEILRMAFACAGIANDAKVIRAALPQTVEHPAPGEPSAGHTPEKAVPAQQLVQYRAWIEPGLLDEDRASLSMAEITETGEQPLGGNITVTPEAPQTMPRDPDQNTGRGTRRVLRLSTRLDGKPVVLESVTDR